jgi:hypothetical protein
LWKAKPKEAPKETTAEEAPKETTEEPAPTETTEIQLPAETAEPAPVSETPATEETPAEPKPEKAKRQSIFAGLGLLPKKEAKEKPTTNGDSEEQNVPEAVSEEPEVPAKKDSLSRRLTSGFKSLGRAKSPEKGKSTKVSDEAPKIDTPIESTEAAPVESEIKAEEPLATTEAPATTVEAPTEPTTAPVVTTQA